MINLSVEERIFESELLKFQVRADDPKAEDLVEDASLEHDGDVYFITEVKDSFDERGIALKSIEAEINWMRLADIKRVGSFQIETRTAEEGLIAILNGTSWTAGPCFTTADFSYEGQDMTILGLIWDWCRTVGGEPTFDSMTKTVLIDATAGAYRGLSFRYGRNLKSVERVCQPPQYTRIYPYGRNELDIKGSNNGVPYLEDYSWYTAQGLTLEEAKANYQKDELYSDDSIVSESALYEVAQRRLAISSRPTIKYTAQVLNLSAISGVDETLFKVGDFATVYDEIEAGVLDARVIRKVTWPDSPEKDEVELAFNDVLLPSPGSTSQRANQTKSWELFVRQNEGLRRVRQGHTLLSRIKLKYVEGAEWVCGYSIEGVANGDFTLTLEFTEDETDTPYWETQTVALTNGERFRFNFTKGRKDIPEGQEILVVRAYTDSTSAGLDIDAGLTNFWVLARGTTAGAVTLENSIRFEYTGSVQHWAVPDDVTEIQLEVAGSRGAESAYAGNGGRAIASFGVLAGEEFDIYVGGYGWPNGGAPGGQLGSQGYYGGGSSDVRPAGTGPADTLLMSGAGGGTGQVFTNSFQRGGHGGFYEGETSPPGSELSEPGEGGGAFPGGGATQYAGGVGGGGSEPGNPGTFWQGGSCHPNAGSNFFSFPPGGGGGGWYGGGAGGTSDTSGSGTGGGGGGGSGWMREDGFDLDTFDNDNTGTGYVVISWDDPDVS